MPTATVTIRGQHLDFQPTSIAMLQDEMDQWHGILRDLMRFAFVGRPATFIVAYGIPTLIEKELPNPKRVQLPKRRWLRWASRFIGPWVWVASTESCTEGLLELLQEDMSYELGLWGITSVPADDLAQIESILLEAGTPQAAQSGRELLYPANDGLWLEWVCPAKPIEEICTLFRGICSQAQWESLIEEGKVLD